MEKFTSILQVIKQAWEEINPALLKEVLAKKIIYHEDPNEPPLTTIESVIERWQKDLKTHSNVKLEYEVIDSKENSCIAEWSAQWEDSERGYRKLSGVYYIHIDPEGKLDEFRQWWL